MNVKDLRTLVDNLDEYIHVPGGIERLKRTILHLAVSGQLVPQDPSEGTGEELYEQIQLEKAKLIADGKLKKQKPLPEVSEDEMPFKIPETWKWIRLGGAGSTVTGKTPPTKTFSLVDGSVPFIGPGDITKSNILKNVVPKMISEAAVKYSENAVSGDLLMVCIGGSIGKAALVDDVICFNQQINKLSPVLISPDYLYLVITSRYFHTLVLKAATGGATPIINQTRWSNLLVPVPPLSEQLRIATKVKAISNLIDNLAEKYQSEQVERRMLVVASLAKFAKDEGDLALDQLTEIIKTKEDTAELRKTILQLAVSGQLVPQDPSEGTGEELYEQIQAEKAELIAAGRLKKQKTLIAISKDEVPFGIPETWRWVRLGGISKTISKGTTPSGGRLAYVDSGIRFVRAENVGKDGRVNLNNSRYITQQMNDGPLSRSILEPHDLLISIAGTLGRSSIVAPEQLPLNTNQAVSFTRFLNTQLLYPWFFQKAVASPQLQKVLVSSVKTTAIPNLTLEIISNCIVPLPPESEQRRIVKKTTQLLDLVAPLEDSL